MAGKPTSQPVARYVFPPLPLVATQLVPSAEKKPTGAKRTITCSQGQGQEFQPVLSEGKSSHNWFWFAFDWLKKVTTTTT